MVRELFAKDEFLEVFVDTPLDDCIRRDPKGLYAKALDGRIANFTGVSSPYEAPESAELVLATAALAPEDAAEAVIAELTRRGLV